MTNNTFTDWNGNIFDIGPIYPFVGWEVLMVILLVAFWSGGTSCRSGWRTMPTGAPPRSFATATISPRRLTPSTRPSGCRITAHDW